MNIPNRIHFRTNILIKDDKVKEHSNKASKIHFREDKPCKGKKISKFVLENGDPDFVDERITTDEKKEDE